MELTPEQAREIGGLAYSQIEADNIMLVVRAAQWRNSLARIGVPLPFWMVHDLGLLLVHATGEPRVRPALSRLPEASRSAVEAWGQTLREVAGTEMVEKARAWKLNDSLVVVILLRVLGPTCDRYFGGARGGAGAPLPMDPAVYESALASLPRLYAEANRTEDEAFLRFVQREQLRLLTAIEQIDLDTLRLLGMFGAEASAANAVGLVDLLHVLESPEANDVVNFSLDLLPSVLETRRATGAQTFAADGYAGLARRGSIDSLMLSELAYEEDLFDQRFFENEVFYYAREKTREEDRRCHLLCIDATASMRGQRSVFARGLALTLLKKMQLRGEDVFLRFFDSRLYDTQVSRARSRGQSIDVPYVLSFRGEHGRNYAKVMGLLASDIARLAKREKKQVITYLITHAECHVPLEAIEELRRVTTLYGIFMLPSSGELDLEYLPLLHRSQVVTQAALEKREARAQRAMDIVDDAAGESRAHAPHRASLIPPRADEAAQRAEDLAKAEAEIADLVGGRP